MLITDSLFEPEVQPAKLENAESLLKEMSFFRLFGKNTEIDLNVIGNYKFPIFKNEFWTSKQRACHSIHEISYRACFKPQLPGFFISRLCKPGSVVYDPFLGRGTTLIEARLHGCNVIGNDVNPLSQILTEPRLDPPSLIEVENRLRIIPDKLCKNSLREDLNVFYHPNTLVEICALKEYFDEKRKKDILDKIDKWILMVATNRLTGHSEGFFSVYTLPPNQAATVESQKKINKRLNQTPKYKDTKAIILKKTRSLLSDDFRAAPMQLWNRFYKCSADKTDLIKKCSIDLVVTSPPFLDIVDYLADNWLRIWFTSAVFDENMLWQIKDLDQWIVKMKAVLLELKRVLKDDGTIAFEVGEVRNSKVNLDLHIAEVAIEVGLNPICIVRNEQAFTKTSNCWGVANNRKGTNSNRIVVLRKTI